MIVDPSRPQNLSGAYVDLPSSITSMSYPVIRELLRSCHPIPSVAVSSLSAGLAALAGLPLATGIQLSAAVLAGQLSIGWSNDYLDAERDRAAHRADKPPLRPLRHCAVGNRQAARQ